jgi:hypothetical protein
VSVDAVILGMRIAMTAEVSTITSAAPVVVEQGIMI